MSDQDEFVAFLVDEIGDSRADPVPVWSSGSQPGRPAVADEERGGKVRYAVEVRVFCERPQLLHGIADRLVVPVDRRHVISAHDDVVDVASVCARHGTSRRSSPARASIRCLSHDSDASIAGC